MQSLPTLIKLAQQQLDALQPKIAQKQDEIDAFIAQRDGLGKASVAGFDSAAQQNDITSFAQAGPFMARAKQESQHLAQQQQQAEATLEELRQQLSDLFMEQKRYEVLLEQAEVAAKRKHDKAVQEQLDELVNQRR